MEQTKTQPVVIYTDGGSRGNPGPAALGVVIHDGSEKKEYAQHLGRTTNNVAEYQAVIFALKKTKQLLGSVKAKKHTIQVYMDSELIVKQLNGIYKIKDADLQPLFLEVWNLRLDFGTVLFTHVRREQNKNADQLVNEALNREDTKLL